MGDIIENQISQNLFSKQSEKTFIDKILAKDDVEKIKELIKKDDLTRSDLLELLYMISAVEQKLVNYTEWDRYIILKLFVWVREFVKIMELVYDYEDQQKDIDSKFKLGKEDLKLFIKSKRVMGHNVKFLMDLFLSIMRSSLSINGAAFFEILRNKYELKYSYEGQLMGQSQEKKGLFNFKGAK